MKILVLDNYDSFTYNLVHIIKELGYTQVEVCRNDQIPLDYAASFDKIILSPGPGIPSEAGILLPLIQKYAPTKSILGICLGEQAIGECFGAKLVNLEDVYHGIASTVTITHKDYIFPQDTSSIEVGRYHSWIVSKENFPYEQLTITAEDDEGKIMAICHNKWDVHGLQFHPESVLTPRGKEIIERFLNR